jgi:hypothetical protein
VVHLGWTRRSARADCIGTEPLALHTYIRRFDASVDDAYFAYLYSVLVEHPHIRVSITTEPLAGPDKTVRLGDAPLPDDFEVPDAVRNDVDISAMYGSGVKGRALAFHLSGQAYKSNAQAIEEKREISRQNALMHKSAALRKKRQEEAKKQLADPEKGLIRDLVADDGQGIPKADLNGLAQRWGSRLRLRCDDDEIYSRITGSHRKVAGNSLCREWQLTDRTRKSRQSSGTLCPSPSSPARRGLLRSSLAHL